MSYSRDICPPVRNLLVLYQNDEVFIVAWIAPGLLVFSDEVHPEIRKGSYRTKALTLSHRISETALDDE